MMMSVLPMTANKYSHLTQENMTNEIKREVSTAECAEDLYNICMMLDYTGPSTIAINRTIILKNLIENPCFGILNMSFPRQISIILMIMCLKGGYTYNEIDRYLDRVKTEKLEIDVTAIKEVIRRMSLNIKEENVLLVLAEELMRFKRS